MKLIPIEVRIELSNEELNILNLTREIMRQICDKMDNPEVEAIRVNGATDDCLQAIFDAVDCLQNYI